MDSQDSRRDEPKLTHPPSREDIARTIFIGNIPEGVGGDKGVEAILETAGHLNRFYRASDASNKPQTFGFAEYADAQSLRTATEIFKDVNVPVKRQKPGEKPDKGEKIETTKLQVVVDAASVQYAENWTKSDDENTIQFRIDSAKESLASVIAQLFNPPDVPQMDFGGDTSMHDVHMHDNEESGVVQIDIAASAEDELADIPADMREIVAAEIAAFRDRSNKRDQERLKKEEEIENEQRRRDGRRSPPPAGTPLGPGGANGVPLGPRADRGVQGAPSGPKGAQFSRDHQNNIKFVNGETITNGASIKREDDDDFASDSELEQRRKKKIDAEFDESYRIALKRWMKFEDRSQMSLERTSTRMKNKEAEDQAHRDAQATELKKFDDNLERHPYYRDHGDWMRQREKFRRREEMDDRIDRESEMRELDVKQAQKDHARNEADAFLNQQAEDMLVTQAPREPQPSFKFSLGAATKKLEQNAAFRRTAADVENLLEDEEINDQASTQKRTLIPMTVDASIRANLTEEELQDAQKQLARDIPHDREGLWKWDVSWEHLPDKFIDNEIRVWAANKVLELLGLQEDSIVDEVIAHLKKHSKPDKLVEELYGVSHNILLTIQMESLANSRRRPLRMMRKASLGSCGVW